jgi:predicted nucleic acid-binding protein
MIVISDTSPLNYLLLIGHIDLLPALFGRIVLPTAVHNELLSPEAPAIVAQWANHLPDWVEVRTATTLVVLFSLGQGEAEAIALATEMSADLLLMDERTGRQTGEQQGLTVTGTLGILQRADAKGLIDINTALDRLHQTTFRAAPALIASLRK